ncbi:Protein of unknown function [Gryllus bimaculatus]|nr:Protein of unknown function [Gryllus bimaculatus]
MCTKSPNKRTSGDNPELTLERVDTTACQFYIVVTGLRSCVYLVRMADKTAQERIGLRRWYVNGCNQRESTRELLRICPGNLLQLTHRQHEVRIS